MVYWQTIFISIYCITSFFYTLTPNFYIWSFFKPWHMISTFQLSSSCNGVVIWYNSLIWHITSSEQFYKSQKLCLPQNTPISSDLRLISELQPTFDIGPILDGTYYQSVNTTTLLPKTWESQSSYKKLGLYSNIYPYTIELEDVILCKAGKCHLKATGFAQCWKILASLSTRKCWACSI